MPSRDAVLVRGSLVVLGLALLAAAFYAGTRMHPVAAASPSRSAPVTATSPTTAPAPSSAPTATGPVPPGEHRWTELAAGECLGTFESAWQATYDVGPCSATHAAQLVRVVPFSGSGTAYPGNATLASSLSLACGSSAVVAHADRYTDLRVSVSYPTAAQWGAGVRTGSCFVSRAGGGTITGSLAAG